MTTTTAWIEKQNNPTVRSGIATIDASETASLTVPCGGRAMVRLGVPTIDTATLTFTVQPYPGAMFRALKSPAGNAVTVASSTGGFVVNIPELSGCYAFTIVAGASQTSGAVAIDVQCVGLDPTAAGALGAA